MWDTSAVATLDAVVAASLRAVDAGITGLTDHSAEPHGRLTGQLTGSH